jgi:hypothetical protein
MPFWATAEWYADARSACLPSSVSYSTCRGPQSSCRFPLYFGNTAGGLLPFSALKLGKPTRNGKGLECETVCDRLLLVGLFAEQTTCFKLARACP